MGCERIMSESKNNVEVKAPNLPLEPIVLSDDPEYTEIRDAYDKLLAEYERLKEIRSSQVDGAPWRRDNGKRIYSGEEYNGMLAAYMASRKAYVERFAEKLETIDMVREKIRRIEEEESQFDRDNPMEDVLPENLDFEDVPDESLESFCKRSEEYWKVVLSSMKKSRQSMEANMQRVGFIVRWAEEAGKFEELEREL